MALNARLTALEQKTEQRHEQTQNTLSQTSNGMQGIMMAVERSITMTTQHGAGLIALVSHVNTASAALKASGFANLPAPLPVSEQVAIVPVTPTPPIPATSTAGGLRECTGPRQCARRVGCGGRSASAATSENGGRPSVCRAL